jgi:hypothetical protein
VIVTTTLFDVAPVVAVSVTAVLAVTALVGIEKPTVLVPSGTMMVSGGETLASELDSVTMTPPAGAVPEMLTRPESILPPCSVELDVRYAVTTGARMRAMPTLLIAPVVAVMLTFVSEATGTVVTGNDTFVAPAGTTTDTGTAATPGNALTRLTLVPPSGA